MQMAAHTIAALAAHGKATTLEGRDTSRPSDVIVSAAASQPSGQFAKWAAPAQRSVPASRSFASILSR